MTRGLTGTLLPVLLSGLPACRRAPEPAAPTEPVAPAATVPGAPQNLLLVTLDTTRADHIGAYGYFRDTSPHFDALARRGLLFERCLAHLAFTLPAHTTLFTGVPPWRHGVLSNLDFGDQPDSRQAGLGFFAEFASAAGYETAAFVSAAPVKRGTGLDAGFATWDEPEELDRRAGPTTDAALAWLKGRGVRPWFLWVHLWDPHQPLDPPAPYGTWPDQPEALLGHLAERGLGLVEHPEPSGDRLDLRAALDAYDGEIAYADAQLGRLLDALQARPDAAQTAVVVLGDHGEGLGQHNWLEHGLTWDEQLHVPLVMALPGVPPARVATPLALPDVLPTLVGRLGLVGFDSFLAQASGRDVMAGEPEAPILSLVPSHLGRADHDCALTAGRWKLLLANPAVEGAGDMLFDLREDPHELRDLAAARPAVLAALRDDARPACAALRARTAADPIAGPRPGTDRLREQLEALGYRDPAQVP